MNLNTAAELDSEILAQFKNYSDVIYLDTAGKSRLPSSVESIGNEAIRRKCVPWTGLLGDSTLLREQFAALINAQSSDIAITPSTAFAMTLAAQSVISTGRLKCNQVVLIPALEMASAVYPWQMACEKTGAKLKVISNPYFSTESYDPAQGVSWGQIIINSIDDNVAVLALPCVHWCDGSLLELETIADHLKTIEVSKRPLLIIDGTQSIGVLQFDVQKLQPTFVACSVHKWLLGPYGMSLVYLHPMMQTTWQPLDQHERARAGIDQPLWEDEIQLNSNRNPIGFPVELVPDARRLDAGGRPNPVIVPMVTESISLVSRWGPAVIQSHLKLLTEGLVKQLLATVGKWIMLVPEKAQSAHILGIRLSNASRQTGLTSWSEIACELELNYKTIVSVRGGCLRVSVYMYTCPEEINKFVCILTQEMKRRLRQLLYKVGIRSNFEVLERRTVLVTGCAGWLGQFIFQHILAWPTQWHLYGCYHSHRPHWLSPEYGVVVELTCEASVRPIIERLKPDVIVHLAAISSPIKCHQDPSAALAVNCPIALIEAVREFAPNCLFILASTDMVYDGEKAPYASPSVAVGAPVNIYGKSKLACEEAVLGLPRAVVLRLSNMLGPPYVYHHAGEKFLQFLTNAFNTRSFVGIRQDEARSFVAVDDVVAVVSSLIHKYGPQSDESNKCTIETKVLNVGGPCGLTRLQVAEVLCAKLNVELRVVSPRKYTAAVSETNDEKRQRLDVGNDLATCWEVHATTAQPAASDAMRSPRDITMVVSDTESVTGVRFRELKEYVLECLKVRSN